MKYASFEEEYAHCFKFCNDHRTILYFIHHLVTVFLFFFHEPFLSPLALMQRALNRSSVLNEWNQRKYESQRNKK